MNYILVIAQARIEAEPHSKPTVMVSASGSDCVATPIFHSLEACRQAWQEWVADHRRTMTSGNYKWEETPEEFDGKFTLRYTRVYNGRTQNFVYTGNIIKLRN